MLGSTVWNVNRLTMRTSYIFEALKARIYEPNISLIRLMLILQNREYHVTLDGIDRHKSSDIKTGGQSH